MTGTPDPTAPGDVSAPASVSPAQPAADPASQSAAVDPQPSPPPPAATPPQPAAVAATDAAPPAPPPAVVGAIAQLREQLAAVAAQSNAIAADVAQHGDQLAQLAAAPPAAPPAASDPGLATKVEALFAANQQIGGILADIMRTVAKHHEVLMLYYRSHLQEEPAPVEQVTFATNALHLPN